LTIFWGVMALTFAMGASLFDNLIEFVNIIGSLFYGTILGVFLVAFFLKWIRGNAVFIAALLAELGVLTIFTLDYFEIINIAYLWLNMIGCLMVVFFASILQLFSGNKDLAGVEA
jgi:SSS family solute:Na+ symporter